MADGGNGGHIVDHGVLAAETFAQQALEAAFAKLVIIIIEVIPSHLVDHEANDELGPLYLGESRGAGKDHHQERNQSFHCNLFYCLLIVCREKVRPHAEIGYKGKNNQHIRA